MARQERRKYEPYLNNDVSADAIPAVSLIRHRAPSLGGFNVDVWNLLLISPETSVVLCLRIPLNVYFRVSQHHPPPLSPQ